MFIIIISPTSETRLQRVPRIRITWWDFARGLMANSSRQLDIATPSE
jgi:hypothetical protein